MWVDLVRYPEVSKYPQVTCFSRSETYPPLGKVIAMQTNTSNEAVAHRIREALAAEGYSQKETANRLNISISQVSRLLSGKSSFRYDHVTTIGKFLGINPRELLGLTNDTCPKKITIKVAATITGKHPETIRKAIRANELRSAQTKEGGWHRVTESDLTAWMAGAR